MVGRIATHDSESLNIRVVDPNQEELFVSTDLSHYAFSFVALEAGTYSICALNKSTAVIEVDFDVRTGINAKDYSMVASTQNLKEFDLKLKKTEDLTNQIHKKIQYLREREEELRNTNTTIHQRVIGYSVSTILLLMVLAFLQIIYLKRFFKAKKMI